MALSESQSYPNSASLMIATWNTVKAGQIPSKESKHTEPTVAVCLTWWYYFPNKYRVGPIKF